MVASSMSIFVLIRSVLEYCCVTWSNSLPVDYLSQDWASPEKSHCISYPLYPASSSGASFFAWQRRARNEWLVMNRKGPWEGYGRQTKPVSLVSPVVSFPPSFARTFSSKDRRLGTRQVRHSTVTTHRITPASLIASFACWEPALQFTLQQQLSTIKESYGKI